MQSCKGSAVNKGKQAKEKKYLKKQNTNYKIEKKTYKGSNFNPERKWPPYGNWKPLQICW